MIEFSISYKDYNFTVIYGQYINGYYIALPYWKIACDASFPDNVNYNQDKLYHSLNLRKDVFTTSFIQELSRVLALEIQEHS